MNNFQNVQKNCDTWTKLELSLRCRDNSLSRLDELRSDLSKVLDLSTDGLPFCLHTESGDALLVGTDA
jgi:hypothetical protein